MRLYITSVLVMLLLFDQQQVTTQSKSKLTSYSLEDAIEDVNTFIPGSKLIFTTAIKIWRVYGEVQQLIDPNSTHIQQSLDDINEELNEIQHHLEEMSKHLNSITHDIKDLRDLITEKVLNELPKEINLDAKMTTIYNHIGKVNLMFDKFKKHSNSSIKFETDTILSFAEKLVDHDCNGVRFHLEEIHQTLTDNSTGISILDIFANERQAKSMMCKRFQSSNFFITKLYNNIMQIELKGLLITQYAYAIKLKFNKNTINSYDTELEEAQEAFFKRTSKTIAEIKRALLRAPQDVWTCDQAKHIEDQTYIKLGPIFQAYVTTEKDSDNPKYLEKYRNKCEGSCYDRNDSGDLCRSNYCKKHNRKCSGIMRDCQARGEHLEICLADMGSERRYEYIALLNEQVVFGRKKSCNANSKVDVYNKFHLGRDCEYCICTCESVEKNMVRYFNLKEVTSDIHENKVVTGVRFAKENNIVHINIEQGQLLKNGKISETTVSWKPLETYTARDSDVVAGQDYHKISWDERAVQLDDLDSPTNSVLTGLRFRVEDKTLRLEIRTTPISFFTGQLKVDESKWLSSSKNYNDRNELKLKDPNLPTSSFVNVPDSTRNEYIKFTTSSLKSDIGQNVVPFIDIQAISAWPPVPLSGAALIHRGEPESAGFLAFKLRTFNFGPYLEEE